MHIRPATLADAEAIGRVHVESWRATYRGILPDAMLDDLSYAVHTARWQRYLADDETIVFVAEDAGDRLAGFVSGGPERTGGFDITAELYAIYLDPAHLGQGIGKQLTCALAATLQERGHQSMLVWVLANNPARHFYEALGGEYLAKTTITLGGVDLVEWAYGWRALDTLAC